jgi:hypothetical protein
MPLHVATIAANLSKSAQYCLILQQTSEVKQESAGAAGDVALWHPELRWYDFMSDVESAVLGSSGQPGTDDGGLHLR